MNLSNNIIKLDNYRKDKTGMDYFDPAPDLLDTVVIGWQKDEDGERQLHIVSNVDSPECLWMIDLAKKIVEGIPPEIIENDNE